MPRCGHRRLVEEDPAEVLAVGEDLVLQRQERAAGVDEVDARQPVVQGHLLRAQVLLDRHRVVGAALDGRVVGDDHALAAAHAADAGDDPRARARRRRTCRARPAARARGTARPCPAAGRRARAGAACRGDVCRARAFSPPPSRTRSSCARRSATSASWSAVLALNSSVVMRLDLRHGLVAPDLVAHGDGELGHRAVHGRGQRQLHLHRLQHHHGLPRLDRVADRDRHEQHAARHRRPQLAVGVRVVRLLGRRLGHVPRPALVADPRRPTTMKAVRPALGRVEDDVERLAAVDGELPVGRGAHAAEAPAVAAGERVVVGAAAPSAWAA